MSRMGFGPVFAYELLTGARRWQMYAVRAGFVMLLLVAVWFMWWEQAQHVGTTRVNLRMHAAIGEAMFFGFFTMLIALVLLAAPAATAGAVCLDKARGNLLLLFVTDLSNIEVVLGKLASRLLPVFGLLVASVPVLSLCLLMGGIDTYAMYTGYAVCAGLALFGCAVALALSVWGRKTHEVLLASYLVEMLLLLAFPVSAGLSRWFGGKGLIDWTAWTNPYVLTFSRYTSFGYRTDGSDFALFLGFTLGTAALLVAVAVATVRGVTVRHSSETRRKGRPFRWPRWLDRFGPGLDWNPVAWREWHRNRPRAWLMVVWGVYYLGGLIGMLCVVILAIDNKGRPGDAGFGAFTAGLQVSVGLLLASVSAVTALSEERVRGSLDVLLTTSLTTRQIVSGKWLGAYRGIPWLAVLPCGVVLVQSATTGEPYRLLSVPIMAAFVLAAGAAVTSFGLALATWIERPGRAMAVSVVGYVALTVGTLVLISMMRHGHDVFETLGAVSPFYGPGELAYEMGTGNHHVRSLISVPFWSAFYAGAAGLIYAITLQTFDARLGRMTGRAVVRRRQAVAYQFEREPGGSRVRLVKARED